MQLIPLLRGAILGGREAVLAVKKKEKTYVGRDNPGGRSPLFKKTLRGRSQDRGNISAEEGRSKRTISGTQVYAGRLPSH